MFRSYLEFYETKVESTPHTTHNTTQYTHNSHTHANPAELVLAPAARHVVAALVLLDSGGALGALPGVGQDPVGGLGLVHALLRPFCRVHR